MITNVILLIVVLLLLDYLHIPFIDYVLFSLNGHDITIHSLLVFGLFLWIIGFLPSPFREIVSVILFLWILSILGILAIGGLANMLLIAVVVVLLINLFR